MARFNPIKNSFVAGELSPRLEGRDDLEHYHNGLRQSVNGIIWPHGGWTRRPGTAFVTEVPDSSEAGRLIPFVFSVDTAYVILANDGLFRYFSNNAAVASVGAFADGALFADGAGFADVGDPIEDTSPYTAAQLRDMQWAQTGDVLYLIHPGHPNRTLTRNSSTNFTLAKIVWEDGKAPLLPPNTDDSLTITPTLVSGDTYTLTASDDLWDFTDGTDVGRAVRIKDGGNEAWLEITSVTSVTVATATRKSGTVPTGGARDDWSLGMFSDTDGARGIAFHENRLFLGGCPRDGERIAGSDSGVYNRFSNDSTLDDNAIYVSTASTGQVQTVQWLSSTNGELSVGTGGGEGVIKSAEDDILTPTSAYYRARTKRGSIHVMPVEVDSDIVFLQRDARTLRRMSFDLSRDRNTAGDMSIFAEHILKPGGGVEMAYQQSPTSIIWVVRGDGQLVGFSIEPEQAVIGAHRHIFGGTSDAISTQAVCESVTVIPSPDGDQDQIWVLVKRRINGGTKRYVEYFKAPFDPDLNPQSTQQQRVDALDDAWFLDSALELNNPVTITNITQANPGVVTATSHGFSEGDLVLIRDVEGMTEVNRKKYKVSNPTSNTFELQTNAAVPLDVDTSDFTAYISGGEVREMVTTVTGLSHLEGEEVAVSTDAAEHPNETVSGGSITLDRPAARVLVGLYRKPFGETQRFTGGGRIGSDQGQKARLQRLSIRLLNTVSCHVGVGPDPDNLEEIRFREGTWFYDAPPPLHSGDKDVPMEGPWSTQPTVYFEQQSPNMPLTVLATMPRGESGER